jgi:hypothetical protein
MPGPWAWSLLAIAVFAAGFVAVMAFRGLVDTIDGTAERCSVCGRAGALPLPLLRHQCWRCRHPSHGSSPTKQAS